MASAAIDIERPTSARSRALFVATICTGSFLLFLVQPMIARMALPRLGGAPAVWNSAMLVYQALLLGGYAYAHWLSRRSPRSQGGIHLMLFALGALLLPIGLVAVDPQADANPLLWVPYLLVTSIGPLFFVVAAQAPLMQRWFALSGGRDPYPLYAASNIGSFGGLIAYPLLVEPLMTLPQQRWLWTFGYVVLAALVAVCALRMPARIDETAQDDSAPRPTVRQVAGWIVLAAVPSGLMLSTTTHLTTDIVAMPLLWVVPLGLYLLSFSVAFAENQGLAANVSRVAALCLLIGGGPAFTMSATMPWAYAALGLALLFVISVALHSALYARRPEPSQLTAFYLAMSAGGVLGGLFCALLAPLVFDWGYEHPILLAAAALLVPQTVLFPSIAKRLARPVVASAVAIAAIALSIGAEIAFPGDSVPIGKAFVAVALAAIAAAAIGHRIVFTFALSALALTLGGWSTIATSAKPDARSRSYFGINTVGTNPDGTRYLLHGTTLHGLQQTAPGRETEITKYFGPNSGIGMAMPLVPTFGPNARIGLVGLGAGTLACYARPGENWRLYEIDPAVVAIARNPRQFSFLARCLPDAPIILGDARLSLGRERTEAFDMLILDAFSADTIPIHLLTTEAFDLWTRKVTPSGLLMVQISNRFMDLEPVLAAQRQQGWHGVIRDHRTTAAEQAQHYSSSTWVALSRDPRTIARLTASNPAGAWQPLRERPGFTRWTDHYATILPLLKR